MCGIVGYIGPRQAAGLLLEGLRRLEYRGYDSAGIAVVNGNGLEIMKAAGKLWCWSRSWTTSMPAGTLGIGAHPLGHARRADHAQRASRTPTSPAGSPSSTTASSRTRAPSGRRSSARGHTFKSETDTEVLAHLVGEFDQGNLEEAVAAALRDVDGAYGLAVISADEPGVLVAARKGSPLLVGVGENEYFVASDASPLLQHTRSVVYLDDGEMVVLTRDGYRVRNLETTRISKPVNQIDWDLAMVERGGFAALHAQGDLRAAARVSATRCAATCWRTRGPSRVGGLNLTRRRAQADRADHHHRLRHELALGADRRVHARGAGADPGRGRVRLASSATATRSSTDRTLVHRHLAVGRDGRHAGGDPRGQAPRRPDARAGERGRLDDRARGRRRHLPARRPRDRRRQHQGVHQPGGRARAADAPARPAPEPAASCRAAQFIEALRRLPEQIAADPRARERDRGARRAVPQDHARTPSTSAAACNFPVALEGALKLKEICYIHAEGYPAAEMKHGPIALIDENMPVVFIAPHDAVHSKIVSNIEEVKARGGKVIALINEGDARDRAAGRRDVRDSRDARHADADPDEHPAAAARVLRRGGARVQRGPAAEPGQVGDGGVSPGHRATKTRSRGRILAEPAI